MKKLNERFEQLVLEADDIIDNKVHKSNSMGMSGEYVDSERLHEWIIKSKNLLTLLGGGADSVHVQYFTKSEKVTVGDTNLLILKRLRSCLRAAQDDYRSGFITSIRTLIQAEVFQSELEQAAELLRLGYDLPAGVIARTVLETGLRELCGRQDPKIEHQKLEKMNADLVKAGAYNVIVQKRVTAMAAIGNAAAHGNRAEFTKADVQVLLSDVERFLGSYLE